MIGGAAKPTLGSETRITLRETTQACNIWYQGGPGYRSYASIPRGLRCEPWSGRAEDIGMNGDNRLLLGGICRQSVEEADVVWAVCVRDVHRTLDRLRTSARGSGRARHAMVPSPWEQVQGLLVRSGLIFGPVGGR